MEKVAQQAVVISNTQLGLATDYVDQPQELSLDLLDLVSGGEGEGSTEMPTKGWSEAK